MKKIKNLGGEINTIKADLSIESEIERVVDEALAIYNKIDILVNNAGIVYDREFEEIKYDESLQILKTNMLAPTLF